MATPRNCTECQHVRSCHAPYYGSSLCNHTTEINRAGIARTLKEERKHEEDLHQPGTL